MRTKTTKIANVMTPPVLLGTYTPPRIRKGRRATCLYRDCEVVITGRTNAPIPWPRCRALHQRGGSGLLVDGELERAIRTESALALRHWFGVSKSAVNAWRRWAGVAGQTTTEGSRQLHREHSINGAAAMKAKDWTDEELDAKSKAAKRIGLRPGNRWAETGWTAAEVELLASMADADVARRTGRTANAVRVKRWRVGSQIS